MVNEKRVKFNGDQLMLIAVQNMSPDLVSYLCNTMYLTPSMTSVNKAFQRVQRFIDDFNDGGWNTVISAREVCLSLDTLLKCHSFDLGLEDDDRWCPLAEALQQISKLVEE